MKKYVLLFLFIQSILTVSGNNLVEWCREYRSSCSTYLQDVFVDKDGNTYLTGGFGCPMNGAFIKKYDKNGIIQWQKDIVPDSVGGSPYGIGQFLKMSKYGSIYVFARGYTKSSLTKYDSNGNIIWVKSLNFPQCQNLIVSESENIYLAYEQVNGDTLFAMRMDSSGGILWSNIVYTDIYHTVTQISITNNEDFVVVYQKSPNYEHYCSIIDSSGSSMITTYTGINTISQKCKVDYFNRILIYGFSDVLKRYDRTGNIIDSIDLNSLSILNFTFDSLGNYYFITGGWAGSTFYTIIKTDSSGNQKWQKNIQGNGSQLMTILGIKLKNINSIYLTGVETMVNTNPDSWDQLFLVELDSSGTEKSRMSHYSADSYQLRNPFTYFDNDSNVYVTLGVGCIPGEYYYSVKFCSDCEPNIKGNIYHDVNRDCNKDTAENALSGEIVLLTPDSLYACTDPNGDFYYIRPAGTYEVDYKPYQYWAKICPAATHAITLSSQDSLSFENNFAVDDTDNVIDLSVNMVCRGARPGFNSYVNLTFKNKGTVAMPAQLKLKIDSIFFLISSTTIPDVITADTLYWNLDTLQPREINFIQLCFHVDSNVPIGQYYYNCALIGSIASDFYPLDNLDSNTSIVVGSFDPNEKKNIPAGAGNNGSISINDSLLHYIIYFQNTGSDSAINVMITDTIDSSLDLGSFEMESASHPYSLELRNRTLRWTFNNIHLPDSGSNYLLSQGFIRFSLRQKAGLQIGAIIQNHADIFFDYNIPVRTNTVINTISSAISVNELTWIDFSIYPNPSTGVFRIAINGNESDVKQMIVSDIEGRLIFKSDRYSHIIKIDSPGIYLLSINYKDAYLIQNKLVVLNKE